MLSVRTLYTLYYFFANEVTLKYSTFPVGKVLLQYIQQQSLHWTKNMQDI